MDENLGEREGESKIAFMYFLILADCTDIERFFICTAAELSRRNSEENVENISLPKKAVVVLKKELAQKTEALNTALKRENELKVSRLQPIHQQDSECLCA